MRFLRPPADQLERDEAFARHPSNQWRPDNDALRARLESAPWFRIDPSERDSRDQPGHPDLV